MNFRRALFIADSGNSRIKCLDSADGSLYATWNNLTQYLEYPRTHPPDDDNWVPNYYLGGNLAADGLGGMAYDGQYLYVGENTAGKIYKTDPKVSRTELPILKTGIFPTKPEGSDDDIIYDMCYWNRNIYVTNRCQTNTETRDDIHVFETSGMTHIMTLSIPWDGSGDKPIPTGICTDGLYLYVLEGAPNPRIHKFYLTGEYVKSFGKYGTSAASNIEPEFYYPTGIDTDGKSLHVLDAYTGNWRVSLVGIGTEKQSGVSGSWGCTDDKIKNGTVLKLDNIGRYLCVADSTANCPRVLKWHQYYNYFAWKHGTTGVGGAGLNELDTAKSVAVLNPLVTPEGSQNDTLFIANSNHITIWDKDKLRAVRKLPVPTSIFGADATNSLVAVAVYEEYLYAFYESDPGGLVKYRLPDYEIVAYHDYTEGGQYGWLDVECICTDGEYVYLTDWSSTDDYYDIGGDPPARGAIQKWKCSDLSYVSGAYFYSVYPPYAEDEPFPGNDSYLWWPVQIDTDGEHLYVVSYDDGNIVRLKCSDLSFVDTTTTPNVNNWYTPPSQPCTDTEIGGCLGLCVSPDGEFVYYAESWNYHRMTKRRTSDWSIVEQLDHLAGPYGDGYGYTSDVLMWNHGLTTDGEYLYFGSGFDWFDPGCIRKHSCADLSFVDWAGWHDYDNDFNPWVIEISSNLDCKKVKKTTWLQYSGGCKDAVPSIVAGTTPGYRQTGWIPFHLLDIYSSQGSFHVSNSDRPLIWEGNSYACFPFVVEPAIRKPNMFEHTTKISVSNIDRGIASIILSETLQGKRITVWKSYWTQTFTHTLPYIYFDGMVSEVGINESENRSDVSLELRNDFWNWQRAIPNRTFAPSCNWKFKSSTPGCQYTGTAKECDRSYERCKVLENLERFGGFRHMPILEDYAVWWGSTRETTDEG